MSIDNFKRFYLPTKETRSFNITDTVRHTTTELSRTNGTLPVLRRNGIQRRIEAVQVVDGRARFAAKQVAHFVAHAAMVIVLDVAYIFVVTKKN